MKGKIRRRTKDTNIETLRSTNSHQETLTKFLAVLKVSNILGVLESSEQIFARKRSSGAPAVLFACENLHIQAPSPNKRRFETSRKLISATAFIPVNTVF